MTKLEERANAFAGSLKTYTGRDKELIAFGFRYGAEHQTSLIAQCVIQLSKSDHLKIDEQQLLIVVADVIEKTVKS